MNPVNLCNTGSNIPKNLLFGRNLLSKMRLSQLCLILKVVYSEEIRGRDRYRKLQKALHYYYALKLRYRKYFNEDKKKL